MHIGIDVRPLQLDAYRERGIGIHIRNWIEAAQNLPAEETFSLLYDPILPLPQVQLTSPQWQLKAFDFPDWTPTLSSGELALDPDTEFRFDSVFEGFLQQAGIDLFHATHSLMMEAYVPRRLYQTRWIATYHDLIPVRFYDEYLAHLGKRGAHSVAQRIGATVYASRVQTVSQASKEDLIAMAHVAPDVVDVVYNGVNEAFIPLQDETRLSHLLKTLKVPQPYLFSVSGLHHSKNFDGLLAAYQLLPESLRKRYPLVVLLPLNAQTKVAIQQQIIDLALQDTVLLVNDISQEQLIALYSGATVVVHPTRFEGFGLPILEAMRCGTPVVCANTSSMPEVAGDAARLVDPHNPADIAAGIREVITDTNLQARMRELGFPQSARFTWTNTATAVLQAYRQALSTPRNGLNRPYRHRSGRLRLAYWSPFNPKPSGISDYSEFLLTELGRHADVDLFVDGYQPGNLPLFDSFPAYDARVYQTLHTNRPYDLNLYQAGNNPLHAYMYQPMLQRPGIITLHDYCLFHFIFAVFNRKNDQPGFWQEVAYCEGDSAAAKARREFYLDEYNDYELAINKRLVERSLGVVVHSHLSAQKLSQYPAVPPIEEIPMGTWLMDDDGGQFQQHIRQVLRLPVDSFVFGMFGNLHPVKRVAAIFNAFARVRKKHPRAVLLVLGAVSPALNKFMQPYRENWQQSQAAGLHLHLRYVTFDLMLMAMQAIDVGLNLRYPTAGETSSTLSFLLGQGKPTIVSDVGTFRDYPDSCCPKIPVDHQEEDVLFAQMMTFIDNQQHYQHSSQAAFDYARDKTWALTAERYLQFVEQILGNKQS